MYVGDLKNLNNSIFIPLPNNVEAFFFIEVFCDYCIIFIFMNKSMKSLPFHELQRIN